MLTIARMSDSVGALTLVLRTRGDELPFSIGQVSGIRLSVCSPSLSNWGSLYPIPQQALRNSPRTAPTRLARLQLVCYNVVVTGQLLGEPLQPSCSPAPSNL